MTKVTIDTQGQPTTVVVDGKEADFGPSSGGGDLSAPSSDTPALSISTKPVTSGDLGTGYGPRVELEVNSQQILGLGMNVRSGVNVREIAVSGMPGGWFNRLSWAIFDSGGGKAMGEDNVLAAGSTGWSIATDRLGVLGAGNYTFAVAVNGPVQGMGKLGVNYNQQP